MWRRVIGLGGTAPRLKRTLNREIPTFVPLLEPLDGACQENVSAVNRIEGPNALVETILEKRGVSIA